MITPEQVADLQSGDVVELHDDRWPEGTVVRGPLYFDAETLHVAGEYVRHYDGKPPFVAKHQTLTVVSRAPRPLYVNHPRTEPISGDVVRSDGPDSYKPWVYSGAVWRSHVGATFDRSAMPERLRLLVDGETGMPVGPDLAEAWDEGFEAGAAHVAAEGRGPVDPPHNPYETGQVVQ